MSAEVIRPLFGDPDLSVNRKEDRTPVTEADRRAEAAMRQLIAERHPDHGIVGEEYGTYAEDAEWVWVLDPIDGTKSFAANCPLFGTLIGLLHQGQPVLGAINQPIMNQLCLGDNERTVLNGSPVKVRTPPSLDQATLLATDVVEARQRLGRETIDGLIERVGMFRTWGDCYGYLLLASGWADAMLDPVMNSWDLLPLIPVIRGAGGRITSWEGRDPVTATSCLAAHPDLHEKILKLKN